MAVVAAVGDGAEEARGGARIELGSLPDGARERLFERRPAETDPVDTALLQEVLGYVPKVGDVFVTPLRIREELTGEIVVASVAPLSRENREARRSRSRWRIPRARSNWRTRRSTTR